jgi:protein TonB
MATLSLVLTILLISFIVKLISGDDIVGGRAVVIRTIADLGPPPSIAKKPPQVKVNTPDVVAPKVGIPTPVADDEVLDDDIVIASREDLAEIIAPDLTQMAGDGDIVVDIEDYIPGQGEFVPMEIQPEMIYREIPAYPRLAKQAGIEGDVWVKALVMKDGTVKEAKVGKSSGTDSLDDAAVKAALNNRFKPGIQNGRPINCWVTYKVEFNLND